MTTTFEELGISAPFVKALKENEFNEPFPIQEKAIPILLKGVDMIGQAHTGTGKTAAFVLPILNNIKNRAPLQALILVPTRELALQVTNEIHKFAKYSGIRALAIYGGQSIGIQQEQLRKGVQIVVATPGRLIDHLKRGSIQLDNVRYVVLDEADRMLDMGFIEDIKFILFYVDEDRQTCLFSATMPIEVLNLAQDYMKEYEEVRLNMEEPSLETIEQSYLIVRENEKFKHLCNLIKNRDQKQQTIVFVATKHRTQRVLDNLRDEGFRAITIHGDLSQKQRNTAIWKFRNRIEDVLVATDIVARGIDVPTVGHIINYDVPEDPLIYFHRIGRTARAGANGIAISLVSHDRVETFSRILKKTKHIMRKLNDEMGIEVPIQQSIPYKRPYRTYNRNYGYTGNNNNRRYDGPHRYGQNYTTENSYRYRNSYGNHNTYRRTNNRISDS